MALSVGQNDDALEQPSQFMLYHYVFWRCESGKTSHLQPSWSPSDFLFDQWC